MTQYQKILALVMRRRKIQIWFTASDFMKPELGDLFVGYEASARVSELIKKYPDAFNIRRDGKYRNFSFRFENLKQIRNLFEPDLVETMDQELHRAGFEIPASIKRPVNTELQPFTLMTKQNGLQVYLVNGSHGKQYEVTYINGFANCNCEAYRFAGKKKECKHTKLINLHLKKLSMQSVEANQTAIF